MKLTQDLEHVVLYDINFFLINVSLIVKNHVYISFLSVFEAKSP